MQWNRAGHDARGSDGSRPFGYRGNPDPRVRICTPWIEQINVELGEVPHIPGHEHQLVLNGHGGDPGVGGDRAAAEAIAVAYEASPNGGRAAVERQDAPIELPGEMLLDPFLVSFATLLFLHLPNASNELPDGLVGKCQRRSESACGWPV